MSDESWDTAERDLQLLAVLDRFAREAEVGAAPRLSTYLEQYPQFAAELTDFAADYAFTAAPAAPDGTPDLAASRRTAPARATLSTGSQRALAMLFPEPATDDGEAPDAGTLRAVAERRAEYVAGADTSGTGEPGESR